MIDMLYMQHECIMCLDTWMFLISHPFKIEILGHYLLEPSASTASTPPVSSPAQNMFSLHNMSSSWNCCPSTVRLVGFAARTQHWHIDIQSDDKRVQTASCICIPWHLHKDLYDLWHACFGHLWQLSQTSPRGFIIWGRDPLHTLVGWWQALLALKYIHDKHVLHRAACQTDKQFSNDIKTDT